MSIEQTALNELVSGILATVGNPVTAIVLYGSVARGTDAEDSDVDIALLISRPLSFLEEDALTDFTVDMNLKYGKVFSIIEITEMDYRKWYEVVPFYQNISKEGIVLWKAA